MASIKRPVRTKRKANGETYKYPLNHGVGWPRTKAGLLADVLRQEFPDEQVQVLQTSKSLNLWAPFMTQFKYFEQRGSRANNLEMVPFVAKELYQSLPDYQTAIYFEDGNILVGSASPNSDIFVAMEWFRMYPPDDGNRVLYVNRNGGVREETNPSLKLEEIKTQVKEVKNVTEVHGYLPDNSADVLLNGLEKVPEDTLVQIEWDPMYEEFKIFPYSQSGPVLTVEGATISSSEKPVYTFVKARQLKQALKLYEKFTPPNISFMFGDDKPLILDTPVYQPSESGGYAGTLTVMISPAR